MFSVANKEYLTKISWNNRGLFISDGEKPGHLVIQGGWVAHWGGQSPKLFPFVLLGYPQDLQEHPSHVLAICTMAGKRLKTTAARSNRKRLETCQIHRWWLVVELGVEPRQPSSEFMPVLVCQFCHKRTQTADMYFLQSWRLWRPSSRHQQMLCLLRALFRVHRHCLLTVSSMVEEVRGHRSLSPLIRTLNLSTAPGILSLHNSFPSRREEEAATQMTFASLASL